MSSQYENKYDFEFIYMKKVKTPIKDVLWNTVPLLFITFLIIASSMLHLNSYADTELSPTVNTINTINTISNSDSD